MFDPGPALTHGVENRLATGRVRDVGRRQIDQKQPAIGIDGHVTFAADSLLGRVEAARLGRRGLLTDWLSITTAEGLAGAIVVDRVEQQATNEAGTTSTPGREIAGQHHPATARTNQIADRVDHFP
jgi:hypothetical protein